RGVPAVSINWGAWSEVGSAADPELLARLKGRGVDAIAPGAGLATLDLILQAGTAQVAVVPIDWPTVLGGVAASGGDPLLADLVATEQAAAASAPSRNVELLAALAGAPPDDVQHEVVGYLLQTLGIVLGRGVTAGDADRSLHELGLDSLIAIDLRNRILAELEVDVPIEEIVQGGTTIELAALIAATLMITLPGAEAGPEAVYEEFTL
ncbi:MAG: hypothetical protein QOI98_3542, partial [Solirubrobacteraceae bacterium]|nr:hypothetical protein [Solirubrobacteraceae bacterium]